MSLNRNDLSQIIGKTIKAVVSKSPANAPHEQLVLVFTDGTYYELYGDDINAVSNLSKGDEKEAARYLAGTGGKVTVCA